MQLLSTNYKTAKSDRSGKGYATRIMHLSPHRIVSAETLCPSSTSGCRAACLYTAGRGRMPRTALARLRRTRLLVEDPFRFFLLLVEEIAFFERWCKRKGLLPAVRLNGTSDIAWEEWTLADHGNLMTIFPAVAFYDYTKIYDRMWFGKGSTQHGNYHLTFSLSEDNFDQAWDVLTDDGQIAVVFEGPELPAEWNGYPVLDGDEDDLRFIEPVNAVIGLRAKGRGTADKTGFVERK